MTERLKQTFRDQNRNLMSGEAEKPGGLFSSQSTWRSLQIQKTFCILVHTASSNSHSTVDLARLLALRNRLLIRDCLVAPFGDRSHNLAGPVIGKLFPNYLRSFGRQVTGQ